MTTIKREFDPEAAKREFMALLGFVHECRGLIYCKACDYEFSETGKAAIAEYVEARRREACSQCGQGPSQCACFDIDPMPRNESEVLNG